jgi:predicted RNase H-like HicB family nuclease
MSVKSKNFRNKIDAPFAPEVLRRAQAIASRYQIIVMFEDGEYYGRGLELPLVMDDGPTPEACLENTREALVVTVASMLEDGQVPPSPASQGKRDQQINIRLSALERSALEESARQAGYSGVSEYVRAAALSHGSEAPKATARPRTVGIRKLKTASK